jgi:hypothetical protein
MISACCQEQADGSRQSAGDTHVAHAAITAICLLPSACFFVVGGFCFLNSLLLRPVPGSFFSGTCV